MAVAREDIPQARILSELFCDNATDSCLLPLILNIFLFKFDYGEGYGSEFDEQEAAERSGFRKQNFSLELQG